VRSPSNAALVIGALALAAALGLGTADLATRGGYPFGSVRAGPWTTWPRVGSREADPYARAVMARNADVPLAVGEGLALTANVDDAGRPLDSGCIYRIGSEMPPARFWTLTFYDSAGRLVASEANRSGFTSAEILRDAAGLFTILAAREPQTGNWLPLPASGPVSIILRLYDTPVAGGAASLEGRSLPKIERLECLP
jgi:hypothetical protein